MKTVNFRQTFVEAHDARSRDPDVSPRRKRALSACCKTDEKSHPRLWAMLEHCVAHRYERQTGQVIVEGFDWQSIKEWLKEHWPQIVSMLCSIISLFIFLEPAPTAAEGDHEGRLEGLLPDFDPMIIKAKDTMERIDLLVDDIRKKIDDIWLRLFVK